MSPELDSVFNDLKSIIDKKYGKESGLLTKLTDESVVLGSEDVLATGSIGLDCALGVGGYRRGRIIEIYGAESSAKSTLCLHSIANAQQQGHLCAYLDIEHCLAEGTLIYSPEEGRNKTVEELYEEGKEFKVVSSDSKNNLIIQDAYITKKSKRKVFKIKGRYGREIELTDNHKILTKTGYKEVKDLDIGETIYSVSCLPKSEQKDILTKKEKAKYYLLGLHLGDGCYNETNISNIDPEIIEQIKEMSHSLDCKMNKNGQFNWRISSEQKKEKYNISKTDLEKAIKEGLLVKQMATRFNCSRDTVRSRLEKYNLYETVNWKQRSFQTRNKQKDKEIEKQEVTQETQNNLYSFLNKFDCFHKKSRDRRLPKNLTNQQLVQVLSGYFMADGTVVDFDKQKKCSLSFSTGSKLLRLDIETALAKFGIFACPYRSKQKAGYEDCYNIVVNGKDQLTKFLEIFNISSYKKDLIIKAISRSKKSLNKKKYLGDLVETEILEISEVETKKQTYDISIKNQNFLEQNYLANGLIVHNSLDPMYARNLGVDFEKLFISQPDYGEQALDVLDILLKDGNCKLIVVDSVAALIPKAELEGEMADQQVGLQARMMSKAMRKITGLAYKSNALVVLVNQTRDSIGGYGMGKTTPGGNAIKFHASQRVELARIGTAGGGSKYDSTGNVVRARVVKNKVAPPFKTTEFIVTFGIGIDRLEEIITLAVEDKIIKKGGAWFTLNEEKFQGVKQLKEHLKANPELADKIEKELKENRGLI